MCPSATGGVGCTAAAAGSGVGAGVGVAGSGAGAAVGGITPSSAAGAGAAGAGIDTLSAVSSGGTADDAPSGTFSMSWIDDLNSLSINSPTSTLLTRGLSLSGWITRSPRVLGR